jgi:C4-dicarboxylate-specific signal transduction histidine kinase
VGAAVEAALRLARVQPRGRGVEARLDVPPDLPPALADGPRLEQVFLNLLLNACDAMGPGAGAVEIRARGEAGRVVVTVRDHGPGLPAEVLPRIFDPFFTTKAPGEGTGLGLSVCLGIVGSFGGRLEAGNAEGGGAVFRLDLPAAG